MTLLPSLKAISTAQQTDRPTEREREETWGAAAAATVARGSAGKKRAKEDSTDDTKNDSALSLSLSLSVIAAAQHRPQGHPTGFELELLMRRCIQKRNLYNKGYPLVIVVFFIILPLRIKLTLSFELNTWSHGFIIIPNVVRRFLCRKRKGDVGRVKA